jgi:hypothetical protein
MRRWQSVAPKRFPDRELLAELLGEEELRGCSIRRHADLNSSCGARWRDRVRTVDASTTCSVASEICDR